MGALVLPQMLRRKRFDCQIRMGVLVLPQILGRERVEI
jgi:hypothetical protein